MAQTFDRPHFQYGLGHETSINISDVALFISFMCSVCNSSLVSSTECFNIYFFIMESSTIGTFIHRSALAISSLSSRLLIEIIHKVNTNTLIIVVFL